MSQETRTTTLVGKLLLHVAHRFAQLKANTLCPWAARMAVHVCDFVQQLWCSGGLQAPGSAFLRTASVTPDLEAVAVLLRGRPLLPNSSMFPG